MQEFGADAVVEADAAGHLLHIGADGFAEVGHLVDEGDLHRQEGVGRILDQLRRPSAGEQDRGLVEVQGPVEFAHHRPRPLVLDPHHHAVGPLEVVDRRALAQEFRVGHHGHVRIGPDALDDGFDLVACSHRHGRLGHHHGEAVHEARDLLGHRIDVRQVRMAVAPAAGCSHGDEHGVGLGHRHGRIGRELQAPGLDVARHQKVQARLVDGHDPFFQPCDLARVLVDAGHIMPEIGETRPGNQAHITGANHRNAHTPKPLSLRRQKWIGPLAQSRMRAANRLTFFLIPLQLTSNARHGCAVAFSPA